VILNLAFVPMTLLSGLLIDQSSVEWVLIGGSVLIAVGVAALALSRRYVLGLGLIAVVAMACGGLLVGCTILMPKAFFPDFDFQARIHPVRDRDRFAGAAFNLGNVFFVLGTLLAPPLANLGINRLGFRRALGLIALLCLAPAVAAALTNAQDYPVFNRDQADTEKLFSGPAIWLTALIFFFYGPLENIGVTWASSWLKELGFRSRTRGWIQSGFWISLLISRLGAAFLLEHDLVRPPWVWLVLVPALAAAVLLGNLAGVAGRGAAPWGFMLFGLLLGPVLPTIMGTVYRRFAADAGTAIGAMYAVGALGSLLLVPAMAWFARRHSVQRSLAIPAVMALLLGAVVLALHIA
jgi:MFS family permease